MTANSTPIPTIGWVAIFTGASAILAVVFLALMYAVKQSFGFVNDIFNSLIGIFSLVLAVLLYAEFHARSPILSQLTLGLVVIGAIAMLAGTILSVARITDFVMAGWYTGIGNALVGLWLIGFSYTMLNSELLPRNLAVFGVVTGVFMALGLVGFFGIIAKIDQLNAMPKYLYIAFFCYLGAYILYPIWAIIFGRNLLIR